MVAKSHQEIVSPYIHKAHLSTVAAPTAESSNRKLSPTHFSIVTL